MNLNFKTKYFKRKKLGKKHFRSAYYRIKCNCCHNMFKLYVPDNVETGRFKDEAIYEIAGVPGSRREWREFFKKIGIIYDGGRNEQKRSLSIKPKQNQKGERTSSNFSKG